MKLRDDITAVEFIEARDRKEGCLSLRVYAEDVRYGIISQDYPSLFYEQPPVGSFGKFVSDSYYERWGHLQSINNGLYVCAENESGYQHFTPGLPTDVTADGMPKETI